MHGEEMGGGKIAQASNNLFPTKVRRACLNRISPSHTRNSKIYFLIYRTYRHLFSSVRDHSLPSTPPPRLSSRNTSPSVPFQQQSADNDGRLNSCDIASQEYFLHSSSRPHSFARAVGHGYSTSPVTIVFGLLPKSSQDFVVPTNGDTPFPRAQFALRRVPLSESQKIPAGRLTRSMHLQT